jgi:GT2 family glycosyltransferase
MSTGITIIITVWKRNYLDQQLQSLVEQTLPPACIWIIQNEHHIDIQPVVDKYSAVFPRISVIHAGFNLKFFGRFSLCNLVETDYVLIIDDDVIPARNWLRTCLNKCREYNAVISCTGRIIKPRSFRPEAWQGDERRIYFLGDNQSDDPYNFLPEDTQVDYGCNSYFFRAEWIRHFWSVWPATFLSGEDIHLSASLMITRSIPTIVPQQLSAETTGNRHKFYSQDEVSSWRSADFLDIRQSVFEFFIREKQWQPLQWQARVPALAP